MTEKFSEEDKRDHERDEILKRLWKMPPKPHAEITKKKTTKKTKKKKGARRSR